MEDRWNWVPWASTWLSASPLYSGFSEHDLCLFFGRPYKRTLQLSTWDIINEWTKVSIDFLFRYCRICPILRMAMTADWQVLVIWSDIERCMSMMTPRLRTLVTAGTFTPSTLTTRGCDGVRANLDVKCITSVLDELTSNQFSIDQDVLDAVVDATNSHFSVPGRECEIY